MALPDSYASIDDVKARYEADVINRICWDEGTQSADLNKLARALIDSGSEIDSYLSARYAVPISPAPAILRNMNVDLGLYATALTSDKMFEELARRAENWRKHLVLIAKGQAGLGVREDASDNDTEPAEGSSSSCGYLVSADRV
jgi:phage gp36-like protein